MQTGGLRQAGGPETTLLGPGQMLWQSGADTTDNAVMQHKRRDFIGTTAWGGGGDWFVGLDRQSEAVSQFRTNAFNTGFRRMDSAVAPLPRA